MINCITTLVVDLGLCPVELLPDTSACLQEDEDATPGFQRHFTVRSVGGACNRAALIYQTGSGSPIQVPAVAIDDEGEAEFSLTLFPTAASLNNEVVMVIAVASDSTNPSREAQAAPSVYTIDTEPPSLSLTNPTDAVLTLSHDEDENPSNGLQVTFTGRAGGVTTSDGAAVQLFIDDTAVAIGPVDSDGIFRFPYTFTSSGDYAVRIEADDTCGGHGDLSRVFQVETVAPSVAILDPPDGGTLWSKDDGDPVTAMTYEKDFTVRAENIEVGVDLVLRCGRNELGAPMSEVARMEVTALDDDDEYVIPAALRVDLLGTAQVCLVAVDSLNPAESATARLAVALPAPRLTLLTPEDGTIMRDEVIAVSGTAQNLVGQPLQLHLDAEGDPDPVPVIVSLAPTPIVNNSFSTVLSLALAGVPVPDGRYYLWVNATDTLGNVASEQAASAVGAWIRLDRTAPVLQVTWPPEEGLNPATDPGAEDSAPDSPGYQNHVTVEVIDAPEPTGAEVCLVKDGVDYGCATVAEGETTVTFADVTFQPGENTLEITGQDEPGNEADPVDAVVTLALDAPRVVITTPADGLVTGEATVTVRIEVSDAMGSGPIEGAAVALNVGGAPSGASATALGEGLYEFADVPPRRGERTSSKPRPRPAAATASPIRSRSTSRRPSRASASPGPRGRNNVNLATAQCALGTTDCVATVTVNTVNLEVGSPATLHVDCAGAEQDYEATAEAESISFPDVVLAHGGTCALTVTATDAIEQEASAGPISFAVDRVAPVLDSVNLPTLIQFDADLDTDLPGMQIALPVVLAGVEAGRFVTVHTDSDTAAPAELSLELTEAIADGATTEVDLGVITLPEDNASLTVDVSDAARQPGRPDRLERLREQRGSGRSDHGPEPGPERRLHDERRLCLGRRVQPGRLRLRLGRGRHFQRHGDPRGHRPGQRQPASVLRPR